MSPQPTAGSSGLEYCVHPLVVVNVSDHYNRTRLELGDGDSHPDRGGRVVGCLLGTQKGRTVEVVNSFEMIATPRAGGLDLDPSHQERRKQQYKEVFPELDVVGWYTSGTQVHDGDMDIQQAMTSQCDNPIMLLLDPSPGPGRRDLPLAIFESETHVVEGKTTHQLANVSFTLVASEAERIAVDQECVLRASSRAISNGAGSVVSKLSSASASSSGAKQAAAHMVQMGGAVDMLCHQLGTILDYLQRVHAREAPMDHAVVRAVSAISQQLPDPNSPVFREALAEQTSSALAPVYLAVLTKGADQLYELMRKVSVAHGRSARGTPRGRALE